MFWSLLCAGGRIASFHPARFGIISTPTSLRSGGIRGIPTNLHAVSELRARPTSVTAVWDSRAHRSVNEVRTVRIMLRTVQT